MLTWVLVVAITLGSGNIQTYRGGNLPIEFGSMQECMQMARDAAQEDYPGDKVRYGCELEVNI